MSDQWLSSASDQEDEDTARRQAEADGAQEDFIVEAAREEGRQDGAREEREAAVRYLAAIGFKDLAGDFEAGEHRKEAGNG